MTDRGLLPLNRGFFRPPAWWPPAGVNAGNVCQHASVAGAEWATWKAALLLQGSKGRRWRLNTCKHGGCDDLKTCCTEQEVYVGQGSQTGRVEGDPPKYDCAYNSKRPKYFHSVSMLTFIQGKPGEPGSEGLQGPKGSRVNLFCVHNPALATHKIHEVMFDVLFFWTRSFQGEPGINGLPGMEGLEVIIW